MFDYSLDAIAISRFGISRTGRRTRHVSARIELGFQLGGSARFEVGFELGCRAGGRLDLS